MCDSRAPLCDRGLSLTNAVPRSACVCSVSTVCGVAHWGVLLRKSELTTCSAELDGAGPLSPDEHYLRLRSLINVDDNQVVQSMGGLLAYMLKHRVV